MDRRPCGRSGGCGRVGLRDMDASRGGSGGPQSVAGVGARHGRRVVGSLRLAGEGRPRRAPNRPGGRFPVGRRDGREHRRPHGVSGGGRRRDACRPLRILEGDPRPGPRLRRGSESSTDSPTPASRSSWGSGTRRGSSCWETASTGATPAMCWTRPRKPDTSFPES